MKKNLRKIAAVLMVLAAIVFVVGCSSTATTSVRGTSASNKPAPKNVADEWTIMFYLCGTDLETGGGMATGNLVEIQNTVARDGVNVVIQTGGTKGWQQPENLEIDIREDVIQRWTYDEDGYTLVEELPLQNMGNYKTLAEFIAWAGENYPAKKNLLLLWDHGGGSNSGLIVDELHNNSLIPISELAKALDEGGVYFDVITIDCCLMANIETMEAVQPYADYLVASEETIPGFGMAYTPWLQMLYDNPATDPRSLAVYYVDAAYEKYEAVEQEYLEMGATKDDLAPLTGALTFSAVDLRKIGDVSKAFDNFWLEMASLVSTPDVFGYVGAGSMRAEYYASTTSLGMFDLRSFAEGAKAGGLSASVADPLIEAIDAAVINNRHADGRPRASGISFWYKPSAGVGDLDHYARQSQSAAYLAFLDAASFLWNAPDWVYEQVPHFESVDYEGYIVSGSTTIENDMLTFKADTGLGGIAYVRFVVDEIVGEEGYTYRLGESPDVDADFENGVFSARFNGEWPAVDGNFISLRVVNEDQYSTAYNIPVTIDGEDFQMRVSYIYDNPLTGAFHEDLSGEFVISGLWNGVNSMTGTPGRDVRAKEQIYGSDVEYKLPMVDLGTGENLGSSRTTGVLEFSEDTKIEMADLPFGVYVLRFKVIDIFNNISYTEPLILVADADVTKVYTIESFLMSALEDALAEEEAVDGEAPDKAFRREIAR